MASWLIDSLRELLAWLCLAIVGLIYKPKVVLFLSYENAGKSTFAYLLWEPRLRIHTPTCYPGLVAIAFEHQKLTLIDIGRHGMYRCEWRDVTPRVDGVVFVVDAADRDTIQFARRNWETMQRDPALMDLPTLVFANKVDIPWAMSEEEIRNGLGGLDGHAQLRLVPGSLARQVGHIDGFRWLVKVMNDRASTRHK